MLAFLLAAIAVTAVAAWSDFKTGLIPNAVTLGGVVGGVLAHFVHGAYAVGFQTGISEAGIAVLGALFCAAAPGLMYWKGSMGGGDLKLFAAIGALCQPLLGIESEMYAFLVAAVIAPARLAYEGRLLRVLGGSVALLLNPFLPRERRRDLPAETMASFRLGPSIFVGTLVTLVAHVYEFMTP